MFLFAVLVFKPSITGKAVGSELKQVVVVLKPQSTNMITGAVGFDDKPISLEEMKVSTALAQEKVLDDVNQPSLLDAFLFANPEPDVEAKRLLEIVPAMVVEATPEGIQELKNHPLVEAVYPNIIFNLVLDESVPLINADKPVQADGTNINGSGVSVCVIDTGISPHTAFEDRIVNQQCFCSPTCCPNGNSTDSLATDTHSASHGTHVSGIIASNGQFKGVAPGANIVAVKVCDGGCGLSDIFAGIDYCLQVKDEFNVVAISGSIGDSGNYKTQNQCPTFFDTAINAAYNAGIVSVFATGNNGFPNGINYPGCSPNAIAVGATTKDDQIAGFSNSGSLLEVLAPGVSIMSTKANGQYGKLSGTSQATPHVSGAVALIQQYSQLLSLNLTPDDVKNVLISTGVLIEGFPRIDVFAALQSLGFEAPNTPPVPVIYSPQENSTLTNPVLLQGNATDDGIVSNLTWSENGTLIGFGSSIELNFSFGIHTVTFTAIDDKEAIATTNISFLVVNNTRPVPVILSPELNATVSNPVSLNGNASDVEDGVISDLSWSENGTVLGTGAKLALNLSPGQHTVTLTATDSLQSTAQSSVSFTVQTCKVEVDQNSNDIVDVGDFVILLTGLTEENLPCLSIASESSCTLELDMNANGVVDIGDFVLLLSAYSEESVC